MRQSRYADANLIYRKQILEHLGKRDLKAIRLVGSRYLISLASSLLFTTGVSF